MPLPHVPARQRQRPLLINQRRLQQHVIAYRSSLNDGSNKDRYARWRAQNPGPVSSPRHERTCTNWGQPAASQLRHPRGDRLYLWAAWSASTRETQSAHDRYHHKGLYDLAIKDLTKAIELKPGWAEAYYVRSCVHLAQKDYDAARADLRAAQKLGIDAPAGVIEELRKASGRSE